MCSELEIWVPVLAAFEVGLRMVDHGKWVKESLVWPILVEKVDSFLLRLTLQV
jgi:hypothetical protein